MGGYARVGRVGGQTAGRWPMATHALPRKEYSLYDTKANLVVGWDVDHEKPGIIFRKGRFSM